jgi:2-oxoisovalerate dehydrogenase E1 component alpha subunit
MTNVQESGIGAALEHADLLKLYELMLLARSLDERQWILNRQGKAPFVISCQGHEAAQVGSAYALQPGKDWVLPYYRGLGVVLTLGMTPTDVMLGLFARATDPSSGGRQMPAHYGYRQLNIISQSSPTGTQVPHAAGIGLGIKIRNQLAGRVIDDAVAWVSFGEGTSSQGEIHEAMNLAGAHKLPVIFVCENNGYAISVPQRQQMGVEDVADRAAGYGFSGVVIDGSDVLACFEATQAAVERARRGDGPTLLEFKCVRLTPHSSDDNDRTYRTADELKALKQSDPIAKYANYLQAEELLSDEQDKAIRERVKQQVNQATAEAEAAPPPDASTLLRHIYTELEG